MIGRRRIVVPYILLAVVGWQVQIVVRPVTATVLAVLLAAMLVRARRAGRHRLRGRGRPMATVAAVNRQDH